MPKPANSNPNNRPVFPAQGRGPRWLLAVICLLAGVLMAVALGDYSPAQVNSTSPIGSNVVGRVGANFSFAALRAAGALAFLVPAMLFWVAWVAMRNLHRFGWPRVAAIFVSLVSGCGLATMLDANGSIDSGSQYFSAGWGGITGQLVYNRFSFIYLGTFGSAVILGLIYFVALMTVLTPNPRAELDKLFAALHRWREERARLRAIAAEARRIRKEQEARARADAAAEEARAVLAAAKKAPRAASVTAGTGDRNGSAAGSADAGDNPPPVPPPGPARIVRSTAPVDPASATATPAGAGGIAIVKPEETKKAKSPVVPASDENYQFPPVTLLKEQTRPEGADDDAEYARNMDDLVRILGEFNVAVSPGEIHVGPVITCYEVVPAPGVRVEKIASLDKNIALGMRAQSVRILAPIPGKAAVGIEMPNRTPSPVGMRDILESEDWAAAKAEIPIALGKDVSGKPLISDLSKMPHLLIAGATGSGKSVCINSIIASIVYRKAPKDLRLIMVDPKVVELKVFNSLPHMLIPVVTEPKKVPSALKWLLGEMEQRYQIFAKVGVRNISGFNHRKKNAKPDFPVAGSGATTDLHAPGEQQTLEGVDPFEDDDGIEIPDRLPYIVAIIDELADLMMVAPAEIETSIARLAQLARAAGIHLIIATQRPSVNVITGVIKANLPSRIAFQVASQVDSRTILDGKGADTLIGRGDMLFSPPGSSRLVRAQGAFVSDEEVQEFVEFLKRNGPPQYAAAVQQQIDRGADDEDGDEDEDLGDDSELYEQVLDVLRSTKRASTSMIQRRLKIGYNRAARVMDLLEKRGIIGPENGSSPREILVDLDSL
ncbi:cell division protein FtsK [Opitutaceae bacterium TAV5]|nr:cell division protein FtsK [Opitutaceae bacterium TAV5]